MAGFRSGWPGAFQLEPLDRYAETERKRASSLVKMTIAEKQRRTAAQRIREAQALRVGSMALAPVPEQPEKKGGGGAWAKFKGGLDAVTPDVLESPVKKTGKGALKTLGAAQDYVGAPIMGLTSGRLGAEQQTLPDGTTFREGSPSWSDFGRGIKKLVTQDPRDTYQESRQAFKEGQRDPDLPAWKRVAAEALSDPLTYVTPGATGAAAKVLPQGLRASRGARFAGAILADPGRTAAGSVIGSSAAAEVADRTGLPALPATILGGVAGGIAAAPGNLARGARAIDATAAAQERLLPPSRFGAAELGGMEPLPPGKVTFADFEALGPMDKTMAEITAERRGLPPRIDTAAAEDALPPASASAVPPAAGLDAETGPAAGIPELEAPRRLAAEEVVPALQRRIEETRPPGAIPEPAPPPRSEDLFDTISGPARLREEAAFRQTLRGKTEASLKGAVRRPVSDVKTFLSKERNRIAVIRKSREAQADDIFVNATRGLPIVKDADGVNRMPNGAAFEDMFERKPGLGAEAYDALTPQQKQQLEPMYEFGERLNANLRYHNKDGRLPWDDDESFYFPRISIGVDGKKRAYISGGEGSGLKGSKGFMEERTFVDSFEEGLREGINYADSRQAWRMTARAKMKAAENDAIISRLKPMGIPEAQLPQGRVKGVDYVQVSPQLAPQLSNTWFTPEVRDQIQDLLTNDPSFVVKGIEGFNRRATPLRAMADISFLFQQGSPLIFRYPQKAPRALINVIASTKNRKFYDDMMNSVKWNKDEAIEHGLIWGSDDLPSTDFALTKASTTGRITGKPGVKQAAKAYNKVADFSNESFYRYMNYMKANFVKDAQKRLEKMKPNMSPEEWRKEYQGAMNAINRLGGQTGRQTTSLEKLSLFAPTYFSATVEQLNAAIMRGGLEGSIARAQLGRMLAFGATMVVAVNTLRDKETELDPRSSNFLRFRDVGGLDVSPFGTYDTLFRAIAGTALGDPKEGYQGKGPLKYSLPDFSDAKVADYTKLWKLAEGKMSPGLKFIYEPFIKQGNYRGEPYDPSSFTGLAEIAGDQAISALPFSVQNAVTEGIAPAVSERSIDPLVDALPGIVVSGGGATNSPVTPTEKRNWRRDELAQERFGMDYEDLSGRDKSIINEDEKVQAYQADADKNIETLMDDRSVNQRAANEASAKLEALTARLEAKEIPGSEFRKNYRDIQMQQRGVRSVLEQMEGDKDVEGYFNVFTMAERDDGSIDYELLDQLLPEFVAQHPGVEDKVDKITGTKDNATLRRFRVAQQQAREYYALPAYRGLSVEEGKRAQPILATARRLVSNLQATGYKQALVQMLRLGLITRDDMALAIRAQKLGTSPERKKFRVSNPEYAEFYGDAVLDEGFADVGTYSGRGSRRRLPSIIDVGPKRPQIGLSLRPIG